MKSHIFNPEESSKEEKAHFFSSKEVKASKKRKLTSLTPKIEISLLYNSEEKKTNFFNLEEVKTHFFGSEEEKTNFNS